MTQNRHTFVGTTLRTARADFLHVQHKECGCLRVCQNCTKWSPRPCGGWPRKVLPRPIDHTAAPSALFGGGGGGGGDGGGGGGSSSTLTLAAVLSKYAGSA